MTETKVEYVMDNERINTLVAEKVMGWTLGQNVFRRAAWFYDEGKSYRGVDAWYPTTDISDAWQVVERMRELGWQVDMDFYPDEKPGCSLWKRGGQVDAYAEGDSMPLAICLASLKVLGVEVTT